LHALFPFSASSLDLPGISPNKKIFIFPNFYWIYYEHMPIIGVEGINNGHGLTAKWND
jgi:hypothetical protein